MFARVALYEQIDVENWEPVAAWFREHGEALNEQLPGYLGSMTLVDPDNAQAIGIGLYDTAANAEAVDAVMDQGPPSEMPEELQAVLARGARSHRGVYRVVQSAGAMDSTA